MIASNDRAAVGRDPATAGAVRTLSVDLGGTAVKAAVVVAGDHGAGSAGRSTILSERLRRPTPYPLSPADLVDLVAALATELGDHDRVVVGFPGMVRAGHVLTAPFFITTAGPGTSRSADLEEAWTGHDLQRSLSHHLGVPVLVANDADVHGAAVVAGEGLELVVTLGTGVGTALYLDGVLAPHLELAHHPLHGGATYNEHLGDRARRACGDETWSRRVADALDLLHVLVHYDVVWIGGGNARHLRAPQRPDAHLITEHAGLLGGATFPGAVR